MAEQLDEDTFTGAHPTARQFLDQLLAWRYTRCPDNGIHAVLKAPRGGKIRLLRSVAGRADATQVEKAAGYLGITGREEHSNGIRRFAGEAYWSGRRAVDSGQVKGAGTLSGRAC